MRPFVPVIAKSLLGMSNKGIPVNAISWVVAVTAVLSTTYPAHAAVFLSISQAANPVPTSSVKGAQTGYTAFVVKLVSDGAPITAGDFTNNGGGIFVVGGAGALSQRWIDSDEDGSLDPSPKGTVLGTDLISARNHDSHWFQNSTLSEPDAASENNNVAQLPGFADDATTDWGLGSQMKYSFSLRSEAQSQVVTLAYLVIKNGANVQINGQVTVLGNGTPYQVGVPEPSSGAALAMIAIGLLRTRCRFSSASGQR
jgi:hypothetical protein